MKCDLCGVKMGIGAKYVFDTKNKRNFCSVVHLRKWVLSHTGMIYFTLIHKVVTE